MQQMINVVIEFLDVVSMDVTVHVRRDPDEKNKRHGNPEWSVKIGSLEFVCFRWTHDIVSKVFRFVKMQNDTTNAFDDVVGINVEIHLV